MIIQEHDHAARCFDIGGSKIVAADVTAAGAITVVGRTATPADNFNEFCNAIRALCPAGSDAISISIAGNIHPQSGVIQCANIPCIHGRRLATDLQQALARRIYLINDAKAFALAEARFGVAQDHNIVLAIILGTGVGGGIVINKNVLTGTDGTAGEWGHGPATAARTGFMLPDPVCNCGQRSCVDALGGARGLERIYKHMGAAPIDSVEIITAWQAGDPGAARAVDIWLDVVGGALANIVNFLAPSIVAVGGGLANSKPLIQALEREVDDRRLCRQSTPLLYAAVSGPEQGLLGAALNIQV
ncbi:hypothetical protein AB833_11965 [Chromatiales bacterium (ex Bugula neritina AB1)]|nr:hypothetical protein AB833_11965 [Chromatiales bacterium (ex Bugula neritina AB1)]